MNFIQESNGYKVLIVDDEEELRFALKELLEIYGWHVTVCANGHEALVHAASYRYDVIISDIRMPHCNGVEFLERLDPKFKQTTPIIMISAYSDYDEDQLIQLGAKKLIAKPINGAQLVQNMLDLAQKTI